MFQRKPGSTQPLKTAAGAAAEAAAANWLQRRGLVCIERNFRCRGGEIDLIMRDGATLVFVEVRLRNSSGFGSAAESVTPAKQRRVIHAAQYYLATHAGSVDLACRFDVMAAQNRADSIAWEWVRDAFSAS